DAALATGLVAEAIALGVPDERLGQAVHLVVRPVSGGPEDIEDVLSRLLKEELPNFMQPRAIHWRNVMPTNPNGKIDRAALARELGA
ncbi:MAG: AMP-binding protein, partial [Novosphingobium sp.]|nr:AMP-binding protein [Novosphingobium sp.]